MNDNYKVLGVTSDASDEEIEAAYKKLKDKYSEDRFLEGERGNEAAKKLTELENAYAEIKSQRTSSHDENHSGGLDEIERLLKDGKIEEAQAKLDAYSERNAEWHYLQAVVFYKKNWTNESKKQLEIAVNMDPYNSKYSETLSKLRQKTDFNDRKFNGGANNNSASYSSPESENVNDRQMGGSGMNDCMSFCATWCCLNTMMNICCGCR